MPELLNIVNEKGDVFTIPPEQQELAAAHGFRAATEEDLAKYDRKKELSGPAGMIAAATGSAAQGLTFGAFNPLLEKFAPEKAGILKEAQAANPGSSLTGDVAGFAGSLVSPVMKGVSAVGNAVAAKTGSKALQYGAEGMALTLPSAIATGVRDEDYKEAGEMLLANGGMAAVLGAVVRGTEIASAAVKNKMQNYVPDSGKRLSGYIGGRISESVNNLESRAIGLERGSAAKYSEAQIKERLDFARENGLLDIIKSSTTRHEIAGKLKQEAGEKIGLALEKADSLGVPLFDGPAARADADALLEQAGRFGYADRSARAAAKGVVSDLKQLTQRKVGDTIQEVTPPLTQVQELKRKYAALGYDEIGRRLKGAAAQTHADAERLLDTHIGDALERAAEKMPASKAEWLKEKRNYNLASDLEKWTKSLVKRGRNKPVRLSDLSAMGIGGFTHGVPGALAGWVVSGVTHEFGSAAGARALRMSVAGATSANDAVRSAVKAALENAPVDARVGSLNLLRTLVGEKDNHSAAKSVSDRLGEVVSSPQRLQDILAGTTGGLGNVNPQVSAAAQEATISALNKILQLAPKSDAASPFDSNQNKYTDSQVSDFERQLNTLLNPFSALDDIARGTLDPGTMQILQTVYPNLLAKMQAELLDQAAGKEREYSGAQKLNLSIFLGNSVDTLGMAPNIRALQETFKRKEQGQPPGRLGAGPSAKTATNAQTTAQRIEQR